jgi:hypothetical protein
MLRRQFSVPLENIFWILGLIALAAIDPGDPPHLSLCPLKNFGFTFCPGCGIGHSVSWFLHFEFSRSFAAHPLGIAAAVMILYRIVTLQKFYSRSVNHNSF